MTPKEYKKEIKITNKLVLGYEIFYDPKHPLANKCGWVYYHRHVMSMKLNRWLLSEEHVHHIDESKTNNAIENLEILTRKEHAHKHNGIKKKYSCKICGKESSNEKYCSPECSYKGHEKIQFTGNELIELIWSGPMNHVSIELGISDVSLKNRCNKENIPVPPTGYWTSRNSGKSHDEALLQLELNKRPPLPPRFAKDQLDLIFSELRKGDISLRKIGKLVNCSHQSIMRFQKALLENKESDIYLQYKVEKSC